MPAWVINLAFMFLERFGERLLSKLAQSFDDKKAKAEIKNDIKKASKIKEKRARIAALAAHLSHSNKL